MARLNKLQELLHLVEDPLLEKLGNSFDADPRILQFKVQTPLEFQQLIDGNLNGKLEEMLMKSVENSLFNPNKRKNLTGETQVAKKIKTQRFNNLKVLKVSAVTSLKPQLEVSQEELDEFLTKNISELEILSVPEHYPTKPHTVSSLAELYYLTQTLPLIKLLPGSNKALMTENYELALLEGKIAVLYSRIEELKRQGKWSLRQPQRFYDPYTYAKKTKKFIFTWDNLLDEARWMSTEFKESLKFKKSCCVVIAHAVRDYWRYGSVVCVRRKNIVHLSQDEITRANALEAAVPVVDDNVQDTDMGITDEIIQLPILDEIELVPDENTDLPDVDTIMHALDVNIEVTDNVEIAPQISESIDVQLLTKTEDDDEDDENVYFPTPAQILPTVRPTYNAPSSESPFKLHIDINELKKIDQSIIKNLPKFTPFDDVVADVNPTPALKSSDNSMIPVSRLLHPFDEDDDWYKIVLKETNKPSSKKSDGPPEYQKGLFGFQSRRRFSYLKPPKPPLIKNIDYRSPTIWLPQDDKYLIHYVAEFSFNWDLISEHLLLFASSLKKYKSNIERRTPWQCFERYIQLNEKFQFSDMKGVYAYHAQKWLEHAHKAQLTTKRRISPLGVGTESIQRGHRRLRWASLFDAMRKCMKKRELAASKVTSRRLNESSSNGGSASASTQIETTTSTESSNTNNSSNTLNATANGGVVSGGASSVTPSSNSSTGNGISTGSTTRVADRVPTPAELSKLKFDRDKSIQEAHMNQQVTRSRMLAAVTQQQKQQIGVKKQVGATANSNTSVSPSSNVASTSSLTPIAPTAHVPGLGASAGNSNLSSNSITSPISGTGNIQRAQSGLNINTGSPQLQQQQQQKQQLQLQQQLVQQQQLQQQSSTALSNQFHSKGPTTPNGNPYTTEQLQQLIQKQRRMMQQLNLMNSQAKSPSLMQGVSINKLSPQLQQQQLMQNKLANMQQSSPTQALPIQAPLLSQTSQSQGLLGTSATKPRVQFAPAQVSAIINSIQQKNPSFTKEQVTKLAAQYLASLQQQQQNRYNQAQAAQTAQGAQGAQGTTQQQQLQQRLQQQQIQQRIAQPHHPQGASGQYRQQATSTHKSLPQISSLTPQERSQLQMLKAAKSAQQQQLQQQQKVQQLQHNQSAQLQQLQQRKAGSSPVSMPLDMQNMSKLEFEQRKKVILQKQQLQQQQLQQQQLQQQQLLQGQNPLSRAPSSSSSGSPQGSGSPR